MVNSLRILRSKRNLYKITWDKKLLNKWVWGNGFWLVRTALASFFCLFFTHITPLLFLSENTVSVYRSCRSTWSNICVQSWCLLLLSRYINLNSFLLTCQFWYYATNPRGILFPKKSTKKSQKDTAKFFRWKRKRQI